MTTTPLPAADGSAAAVALVPLRTGGKSRLEEALSEGDRTALVLAMLDDVLAAIHAAGIADVRVLAGDREAAEAAEARGLRVHSDPVREYDERPGGSADRSLRAAVDAALAATGDCSMRLVVAADLPRLRAEEVQAVCMDPAQVVVAPTVGGGTGLLRLAPGVTLPTRYGTDSARAHLVEADRHRWSSTLVHLPGARHDVDAAVDLAALREPLEGTLPGAGTTAFLAVLHG